jgi:hypothetical protein
MSSPYREALVPDAPPHEIAWRHRVALSATWLVFLFTAVFLALALGAAPVTGAVVWATAGIGIAVETWLLTTPRPSHRPGWLMWALRVGAIAAPCVPVPAVALFLLGLVTCGWLAYAARLFAAAGRHRDARQARLCAALCVAMSLFDMLPLAWLGAALNFAWLVWLVVLLWRLRRLMLVARTEWWFDAAGDAPGEWVSLLVCQDRALPPNQWVEIERGRGSALVT